MQPLELFKSVALVALLSAGACSDIRQGLDEAADTIGQGLTTASQKIDELLEGESPRDDESLAEAERLYQQALADRTGEGPESGFEKFKRAAELGHGPAAYELGLAYKEGRGTAQDLEAGARWINKAAERGVAEAQYLIGAAYYAGTGGDQDYEVAAAYLGEAAVQGHPKAQYLLGEAFANNRGVPRNLSWAARWYGKAAAQGLDLAQFAYGVVRATGLGLPPNRVAGYGWLVLAGRQGHAKAEAVRQALAQKMTPEQVRKAEAWADRFRPKTDPPFADPPTVMYVQQMLNTLGFEAGPVDGVLGPRTCAAIEGYRRKAKLTPDGEVSPDLLRDLLEEQNKKT